MATISSSFLQTPYQQSSHLFKPHQISTKRAVFFKVQAAKLPAGVELPKSQPKFQAPFLGFTKTAEIWNSRACMIGLIGTFIVELGLFSFIRFSPARATSVAHPLSPSSATGGKTVGSITSLTISPNSATNVFVLRP
ncbi:uncharacterized protein LOC110923694 isoform X1 [Helianthus annuus]|uniref:uncharacterized protein LOC110923694 isoform X1 n=1 Tax=Helianthus annuus TaxID=4232 RepID=UPI0016533C30|nr:uncharacterized protein LOC110923694 isoform X1 [Helianthus annuus]